MLTLGIFAVILILGGLAFFMLVNFVMRLIISIILLLCLIIAGFVGYNFAQLPMLDPPGLFQRLSHYLNTNVAETQYTSPYPELQPREFPDTVEQLFEKTKNAVTTLGWEIVKTDPATLEIDAVITSPLIYFKDDIKINVISSRTGSSLHIRAQSRIGRADFGTNTRHILALYAQLQTNTQ